MKTEREKTREARKLTILNHFSGDERKYTNQVAKEADIVWPVADRLLNELVAEGRLVGDKIKGYALYETPMKLPLWQRLKRRVSF